MSKKGIVNFTCISPFDLQKSHFIHIHNTYVIIQKIKLKLMIYNKTNTINTFIPFPQRFYSNVSVISYGKIL